MLFTGRLLEIYFPPKITRRLLTPICLCRLLEYTGILLTPNLFMVDSVWPLGRLAPIRSTLVLQQPPRDCNWSSWSVRSPPLPLLDPGRQTQSAQEGKGAPEVHQCWATEVGGCCCCCSSNVCIEVMTTVLYMHVACGHVTCMWHVDM